METLLSLCIGIGLSAACGFRIFVPLLAISMATKAGHLTLAKEFMWVGSDTALIAFAVATALEIGAYYIPWLDNLMDTIATPAAVIAGTMVTAAMVSDMSPFLKWTLAVIAGGGAAGLVQTATVVARGTSTVLTGGMANPLIATAELGGAATASVLAIVVPVFCLVLLAVGGFFLVRKLARVKARAAMPPVIPA